MATVADVRTAFDVKLQKAGSQDSDSSSQDLISDSALANYDSESAASQLLLSSTSSSSSSTSGGSQQKLNLLECPEKKIPLLDLSQAFRPEIFNGKPHQEFRIYNENDDDELQQRVKRTYYTIHKNQTVDFVKQRHQRWCKFDNAEMTIIEALIRLNTFIDESDPDCDLPDIVHSFQTAERIRRVYPDNEWFQLTGLLHDLGKVLALWGEKHWAVVGDTFVVGCQFADSIVYRKHSFDSNPDNSDPRYNTKYGMYEPNCGLDNVLFSWGHDEYMYRVLKNHKECKLPEIALKIIRLHSLYPWHKGGDYMHLCDDSDLETLSWNQEFSKFDLYTKSEDLPDVDALLPYYQALLDKYVPGKLKW